METEIGKINVIVEVNRDDQNAAVEAARKWAEAAAPVSQDEDGTFHRSAKHWAERAEELAESVFPASPADAGKVLTVRPDGERGWEEPEVTAEAMADKLDAARYEADAWGRPDAFVVFDASGAILAAQGVASVAKSTFDGIGRSNGFRITLLPEAPNANYSAVGAVTSNTLLYGNILTAWNFGGLPVAKTTSGFMFSWHDYQAQTTAPSLARLNIYF